MNAEQRICESVQDNLKAFCDGELGWLARRRVKRHLHACSECARVLDELRVLSESMRNVDEIEASPGFSERVLAQLRTERQTEPRRAVSGLQRRLKVWYATGGAVVAAAVMIAVLYPMMSRAPEQALVPAAKDALRVGAEVEETDTTAQGQPLARRAEQPDKSVPGSKAVPEEFPTAGEPSPSSAKPAESYEAARDRDVGSVSVAKGVEAPTTRAGVGGKKEGVATEELEKLSLQLGRRGTFEYERQVIRTAAVSLEVEDAQAALDKIAALADSLGGFVQDSSVAKNDEGPSHGQATIRVPSVCFDDAVDRVSGFGKLLDKSTKGEDATAQLVDLEARTKNLRAEEQQYVKILAKARKVSEILSVEYELGRIRGEIEQAEGRKAYLSKRVQLSTISVVFSESQEEKPEAPVGWNIGSTLKDSGLAFLSFAKGLAKALIWVGVFCPVWFPILLLFRYLYRVASGPVAVPDAGK